MPGSEGSHYPVFSSEQAKKALRDLGHKANQLGLKERFVTAAKKIHGRLQTDPLEFGELLYTKGATEDRVGSYDLLFVRYGVETKHNLVIVRHWHVPSHHGF